MAQRPHIPGTPAGYRKALIPLSRKELLAEVELLTARRLIVDLSSRGNVDKMLGWARERLGELDRLEALKEQLRPETEAGADGGGPGSGEGDVLDSAGVRDSTGGGLDSGGEPVSTGNRPGFPGGNLDAAEEPDSAGGGLDAQLDDILYADAPQHTRWRFIRRVFGRS